MLLALEWVGPRFERARALWPFAMIAAAASLLFAWMCDAVGDRNGITYIDGPVSAWFATHRTATEGQLGLLVAKATSPAVLIGLVLLSAIVLRRRGFRLESTLLVAATVAAYGAGAVAKYAEHRARPLAPVNLAPETEPSFPSGHVLVVATIAFVALGLAWAHLQRAARIMAVAVACTATLVVAVDRLTVGAHWLTDVVGSVALSSVIVAIVIAGHRLFPDPR